MAEHPTSLTPQDILQLKDSILNLWHELPQEHQTTLIMVMLSPLMEGEYRSWLFSNIDTLWNEKTSPTTPLPPIPHISRADLKLAHLTEDEIAQLDDTDLLDIAHQILRHYAQDVFWAEIEFLARQILDEKQRGQKGDDGMV
jgi:hypothetical protein